MEFLEIPEELFDTA